MLDPHRPNSAPLQIIRKRNIVMTQILIELPLEFGSITCTGIIGTYNYFGSICDSRGLSTQKPIRSKIFKLMGRIRLRGGAAASAKQIGWLRYEYKSKMRNYATIEY